MKSKQTDQNIQERIELTDEFKEAIRVMGDTDENVYITGKAGTGKSTLLKYFCDRTTKKIIVLAPTGIAAINVEGVTIHSFFLFPFGAIEPKDIAFLHGKKDLFKNLDAVVIEIGRAHV